jgi:DNA-binding transcriptional LysR family regulator
MDIRQIEYFRQFCIDKSFSKAADNLFITQQGLNKAIKNLEHELNVSLYYKNKRDIILTEAGKELFHQTKIMLNDYNTLNRKIAAFSEDNKNRKIRISCAYGVYGQLYACLFSRMEKQFPEISFLFSEQPDLLCEKAVYENDVDIGFTIGPFQDTENIFVLPIKTYTVYAVMSNRHHFAKTSNISCKDIEGENIILVSEDFKIYHEFMRKCRIEKVNPNIVFKASEINSVYSLCQQDAGIGIGLDCLGEHSDCKMIPFASNVLNWTIHMMAKKELLLQKPFSEIKLYIEQFSKRI